MEQKQLERLKACELEMLKAFVEVCDRLELKYYIVGGTLLGAVRHGGFIPWDDDIDVGMPREDYERFIADGQKYLPKDYFLQTNRTDLEWPANFAKIRDSRTTFIESSVKNCKINHGVWIDIFPMDFYPEGWIRRVSFGVKYILCLGRIVQAFDVPKDNSISIKKMGKRVLKSISKMLYPELQSAVDRREQLIKSVPKGSKMLNYSGAWARREIVPAEYYAETIMMSFEGMQVAGLKEYDRWLAHLYGDYMQLPPEEKRVGHHYYEVLDLDKPYTEYMK